MINLYSSIDIGFEFSIPKVSGSDLATDNYIKRISSNVIFFNTTFHTLEATKPINFAKSLPLVSSRFPIKYKGKRG